MTDDGGITMGEVIDFNAHIGAAAKGAKGNGKGGSAKSGTPGKLGVSTKPARSGKADRAGKPVGSTRRVQPEPLTFLRLRITLDHTEPPVWREIIVPATMALSDVAVAIALSFGWSAERLHMFRKGKVCYDDSRAIEDAKILEPANTHIDVAEVNIGDVLKRKGSKIEYVYDTENWWQATVELVQSKISVDDYPFDLVPVCIDGLGLNPPEDAGGVEGYYRFLDAVADPSDPDYAKLRMEAGYDFEERIDESWFEPMAVNERYAPITAAGLMDAYATMNRTQLLDAMRGLLTENLVNSTEAVLALSALQRIDDMADEFSRAYYEMLGTGLDDGFDDELDDEAGGSDSVGRDFSGFNSAGFSFSDLDFGKDGKSGSFKGEPFGWPPDRR